MIYGRPVIRAVASLDVFFDRLLPRTVPPASDTDWRAKKLKEFIDQNQGRLRWRLGDVCKQLGFPMSDRQARRLFRVSIGVGIKEYSMNTRLACAAEQLKGTTPLPIKAIAVDAGYERAAEFGRSFKSLFLLSPTEFRTVWCQNKRAA